MCIPLSNYSSLLPGRAFNRGAVPGHRSLLQAVLPVISRLRFRSRVHPRSCRLLLPLTSSVATSRWRFQESSSHVHPKSWQSPVLRVPVVVISRWRFRVPVHPRSWSSPSSFVTRCVRRLLLPGRAVEAGESQRVNCIPGHCCSLIIPFNGRLLCLLPAQEDCVGLPPRDGTPSQSIK